MYKKILIATDGSQLAQAAIEHGVTLAKSVGSTVVFVTVTENWPVFEMASEVEAGHLGAVSRYEDAVRAAAEKILDEANACAVAQGVKAETRHVIDRPAAEGIIETSELEDCDLIVMASHGRRGLGQMMLGSQTAEVLSFSKKPVLVLR